MTSTTSTPTRFVTSADGTEIAYERTGSGPALVIVDGALCYRDFGPSRELAKELSTDFGGSFTVYCYDRRARGESGAGVAPYALGREVEDLRAVLDAAGGRAVVVGFSSGATLALEAARQGEPIERLAVYESPFIVDATRKPNDPRLPQRMQAFVDDGHRGDAVRLFMRTVGVPAPFIALMRFMPVWKKLTGVAHTLPYDLSFLVEHQQGKAIPSGYYGDVAAETLVLAGGKSPEWMRNSQAAIADAVPRARLDTLAGQTHMVKSKVVAPVLTAFLGG